MRQRCLTSAEIAEVLSYLTSQVSISSQSLVDDYAAAEQWERSLVCHAIFIARHLREEDGGAAKIASIYRCGEECDIEVEEGGRSFVNYFLCHVRAPEETLDEAMIRLRESFGDHNYEQAIRC